MVHTVPRDIESLTNILVRSLMLVIVVHVLEASPNMLFAFIMNEKKEEERLSCSAVSVCQTFIKKRPKKEILLKKTQGRYASRYTR